MKKEQEKIKNEIGRIGNEKDQTKIKKVKIKPEELKKREKRALKEERIELNWNITSEEQRKWKNLTERIEKKEK